MERMQTTTKMPQRTKANVKEQSLQTLQQRIVAGGVDRQLSASSAANSDPPISVNDDHELDWLAEFEEDLLTIGGMPANIKTLPTNRTPRNPFLTPPTSSPATSPQQLLSPTNSEYGQEDASSKREQFVPPPLLPLTVSGGGGVRRPLQYVNEWKLHPVLDASCQFLIDGADRPQASPLRRFHRIVALEKVDKNIVLCDPRQSRKLTDLPPDFTPPASSPPATPQTPSSSVSSSRHPQPDLENEKIAHCHDEQPPPTKKRKLVTTASASPCSEPTPVDYLF